MAETAAALGVDIVVNNFNYERFLGAAMESALAQTHPATRVIAVDDGSTDGSRAVLERFAERADVIFKPNGGQASAFNAGLERCGGDIVVFLDADDLLHPEAAARVAAAFAADPALARVQVRMEVIDAAGAPTGEHKPEARLAMAAGDLRRAELAYPFDLPWLPTSANAFRRATMAPILPIPEDRYPRAGADYHVVHLSTLLGTIGAVEEVSASYRVHGANNFEPAAADLDLDHVRDAIRLCAVTADGLLDLAARQRLPHPDRILSLADLGSRIISLRLDPARHPIAGDTVTGLLADSIRAARRRDNASPALRAALCVWFAAIAIVPRPLARRLATWFYFPSRRPALSTLFARLHR